MATGNEACLRGFEVLYRNTHTLFKWLVAGYADGSHDRRMQQLRNVDVLILDDFGLRELTDASQADLYELISERYEQRPTILTSNRDFDEWPQVFSNPLMGSAAMGSARTPSDEARPRRRELPHERLRRVHQAIDRRRKEGYLEPTDEGGSVQVTTPGQFR
ncbi:MAG: ATP-binding protein [Spirochaetaceae bacterium]